MHPSSPTALSHPGSGSPQRRGLPRTRVAPAARSRLPRSGCQSLWRRCCDRATGARESHGHELASLISGRLGKPPAGLRLRSPRTRPSRVVRTETVASDLSRRAVLAVVGVWRKGDALPRPRELLKRNTATANRRGPAARATTASSTQSDRGSPGRVIGFVVGNQVR